MGFFLPIILMFAIFYFMIIKPQKKEAKRIQILISNLEVGDEILTIAGVVGKVHTIKEDEDTLIIDTEGSKMKIKKKAINGKIEKD